MKMDHSNWTLRFPRTTRCDGHAIHLYRTPLHKRVLFFWCRHGWLFFVVGLAAAVLLEIT